MPTEHHKFWMAIASDPLFTPDDKCRFKVEMCRSHDDKDESHGQTEFFSGDIEEMRKKMYAMVDILLRRGTYVKMLADHEEVIVEKKKAYQAAPKIFDSQISSLTVGEAPDVKKPKEQQTKGLLDLDDLS